VPKDSNASINLKKNDGSLDIRFINVMVKNAFAICVPHYGVINRIKLILLCITLLKCHSRLTTIDLKFSIKSSKILLIYPKYPRSPRNLISVTFNPIIYN
jgi:hypothetical protein